MENLFTKTWNISRNSSHQMWSSMSLWLLVESKPHVLCKLYIQSVCWEKTYNPNVHEVIKYILGKGTWATSTNFSYVTLWITLGGSEIILAETGWDLNSGFLWQQSYLQCLTITKGKCWNMHKVSDINFRVLNKCNNSFLILCWQDKQKIQRDALKSSGVQATDYLEKIYKIKGNKKW